MEKHRSATPLAGLVSALLVAALAPNAAFAKSEKVDVCHITEDGTYNLINISENAVPAHLNHGDTSPGSIAGTNFVDENCSISPITRVESPELVFGPTGWGGWSCPADTPNVVGGGYEPAEATVLVSEAAEPDSDSGLYPNYPHYTFSPGEEGWVVQNSNTQQALVVYALCIAD